MLFRFEQIQVQLRAQQENTIKILDTIKRANTLQVVYAVNLFIFQITSALGNKGPEAFDFSEQAAKALEITGQVFEIAFVCCISYLIKGVNKQLALFFNQVGINNYPKKLITALFAAFFLIVINLDIVRICLINSEDGNIYYYISIWLYFIIYNLVDLGVTGFFFFLADFGFEARAE